MPKDLVAFEHLKDLTPAEREFMSEQAAMLRLSGNGKTPYRKIAEILGCSEPQANALVKEAFRRNYVQDEERLIEVAGRQIARLETLMASHWSRAQKDLATYEVMLKNMAMINEMLGLNAPQRIAIQGEIKHTGDPKADILEILDRIEMRAAPPDDIIDAEIVDES